MHIKEHIIPQKKEIMGVMAFFSIGLAEVVVYARLFSSARKMRMWDIMKSARIIALLRNTVGFSIMSDVR